MKECVLFWESIQMKSRRQGVPRELVSGQLKSTNLKPTNFFQFSEENL